MPAPIAFIAIALAAWQTDPAGACLARINQTFEQAQSAMSKVEEGLLKPEKAAVILGTLLGDCRSHEAEVSAALMDTRQRDDKKGMLVVAWSGTLEAYLSTSILGLDGDDASLTLSRILGARLRREIDRAQR